MPELPDVETFRRYLNATALNQKIARVSVKNTTVLRDTPSRALARRLEDREIRSGRRHGKFLFGLLDGGGAVVFHFGMTGYLKYFKERSEEPKYTRVRFDFSKRAFLGYVSLRMLGLVNYASDVDEYVRQRGSAPTPWSSARRSSRTGSPARSPQSNRR